MSGHSHWATTKHAKAAADAKKGKIFSRIAKEIMLASKTNADPNTNPALRTLIEKGRKANMPKDNIENAIKKGAGTLEGAAAFEEITYEGYAAGGVGLIVNVLTDNKNRAAAEVGHIFKRNGSDFATRGSVSRNFERKGTILVAADAKMGDTPITEDSLMEIALEAGAEDLVATEDGFEITTSPSDYQAVVTAPEQKGIPTASSEVAYLPIEGTTVAVNDLALAKQILKFVNAVDDNEDVQEVFHNAEIPDDILEQAEAEL